MPFSSAQFRAYSQAQAACLTPFEFESLDHWRDAVATRTRAMVVGTMSQVSLFPVDGVARMRSPDIDPAHVQEYVRDWLTQDAVLPLAQSAGLQVYSRSELVRTRPAFGTRYLASPIYNEHYRRVGAVDSIGIVQQRPTFAQVMVFNDRFGTPSFGATGLQLMRMLEPAFLAGARSIFDWQAAAASMARMVDELPGALALYSATGVRLHWNRALRGVLAALPDARLLERALRSLSQELVRLAARDGAPRAVLPRPPVREVVGHRLSGTMARLGVHGSPPLLLVRVESLSSDVRVTPSSPPPVPLPLDALRALTPRQRQVAVRLALGDSNARIAHVLAISEFTARRHTEQVLKRLGVSTRQQAAAMIAPLLARADINA